MQTDTLVVRTIQSYRSGPQSALQVGLLVQLVCYCLTILLDKVVYGPYAIRCILIEVKFNWRQLPNVLDVGTACCSLAVSTLFLVFLVLFQFFACRLLISFLQRMHTSNHRAAGRNAATEDMPLGLVTGEEPLPHLRERTGSRKASNAVSISNQRRFNACRFMQVHTDAYRLHKPVSPAKLGALPRTISFSQLPLTISCASLLSSPASSVAATNTTAQGQVNSVA